MNKYIKESLDIILSNNYYSKKIIAIIIDVILCILSTWLAFALRLEQLILFKDFNFLPAIISIIIAIPIFFYLNYIVQFFVIRVYHTFNNISCYIFLWIIIFFSYRSI